MLQQIFSIKLENHPAAPSGSGSVNVLTPQDETALKTDVDGLYSMSRSGLWSLLIFLASSAVAYYFRNYTLASTFPADVVALLGPAPAVILVNIVFGASTVSSLLIIAGKMYNDRTPSNTWTHLNFRVFIYLLYFIAGALSEYFNVVFISGLVVLALQHFNVWNYYNRAIEIKLNKFEQLEGKGRMS